MVVLTLNRIFGILLKSIKSSVHFFWKFPLFLHSFYNSNRFWQILGFFRREVCDRQEFFKHTSFWGLNPFPGNESPSGLSNRVHALLTVTFRILIAPQLHTYSVMDRRSSKWLLMRKWAETLCRFFVIQQKGTGHEQNGPANLLERFWFGVHFIINSFCRGQSYFLYV